MKGVMYLRRRNPGKQGLADILTKTGHWRREYHQTASSGSSSVLCRPGRQI